MFNFILTLVCLLGIAGTSLFSTFACSEKTTDYEPLTVFATKPSNDNNTNPTDVWRLHEIDITKATEANLPNKLLGVEFDIANTPQNKAGDKLVGLKHKIIMFTSDNMCVVNTYVMYEDSSIKEFEDIYTYQTFKYANKTFVQFNDKGNYYIAQLKVHNKHFSLSYDMRNYRYNHCFFIDPIVTDYAIVTDTYLIE